MASHRRVQAGRKASIAFCLAMAALGLAPVAALTTQGSAPTCEAQSAGRFNACATLDATQVQDRRAWQADTASDWPTWEDGTYACTEEDGSAPGQPFPCRWESAQGSNYTLDAPSN